MSHPTKVFTHDEVIELIEPMVQKIKGSRCYPIPRGGIPVAYLLRGRIPITIVNDPNHADFFLDDIIDSGSTRERYVKKYTKPFYALIDKTGTHRSVKEWIVFPWEHSGNGSSDEDFHHTVRRLLQHIGEDPTRGGLLETPSRVTKAWRHMTSGYQQKAEDVLKVFEDGAEGYDEFVLVKDIPFYSHCEHHMAPFFGTAHIAYIPNGKIVGLSKLSRLLDIFANRLQVQERLTAQVADALMEHLGAKGAAVCVKARHLCMESRGIKKQGSETVTTALRGVFRDDPAARSEFLESVR